jgi:hypothetical protein
MLQHLKTAEEYEEGRKYIQKVAAENGVTFPLVEQTVPDGCGSDGSSRPPG